MKTHKQYRPKVKLTDEEKEYIKRENIKDLIYTALVFLLCLTMIGLIVYAVYAVSAEIAI